MTVQYQGVWTLQSAAQLQSTQRWVTDPLFDYTTLLLQADDAANAAQNNTFLDSSSNSFAITRNGNTTQGSFTPFSLQPGAWGNFFDGTDDYLQRVSPPSGITDWTSTNWTLEYWIYANAFGQGSNSGSNVFGNANDAGNSEYWSFGPISTGAVRWYYFTGASPTITTTTTLAIGRWHHLAFVNNGGNLRIYIDGVSSATGTITGTPQFGAGVAVTLGKLTGSSFNGYISNLRITQSAVYTANFTPSALPLTAISGTQLLMCQSNRFVDNSTNAIVFTPSGTPSVQAFSPFAPQFQWTPSVIGGSGFFDGTGDYLSSATSTDLQLGSSDFSLEWWEYRTAANNVDTAIVCGNGTFSALLGYYNSGAVRFYLSTTGSSWNVFSDTSAGTTASNSWNHFVLTRSGTAFRVFLNGVLGAYATGSGSVTQTTNQIFISGGINGSSVPIEGYMSGVRFVKGSIPTSYQTSSTTTNTPIFTPPTAPVTTTSQGATSGDVKYLVNFTNAGIVDATMKNNLETVGNAQISTAVVKYGSGSMYFDGTGDNLFAPFSQNLQLGTGDFTIEFWINASASGTYNQVVGTLVSGTEAGTWRVGNRYNSTNAMYFARGTGAGFEEAVYGNVNVNDGLWHHVACVRIAGVIFMYVDGVARTVTSGTASISGTCSSSNAFYVGYNGRDNSYITGYLDDVRITRGAARYTQNFIPPSVALPRQ